MKRFIEDSQNLKGEIKSNPQIVEAIRSCFSGNSEPFAEGTEHQIYRLGKTNSGVYPVLRKKKFDIENETERFEIYCRNAEALAISKEKGLFGDQIHLVFVLESFIKKKKLVLLPKI